MFIRKMMSGDVTEILRIEKESYIPELYEPPETFVNKMTLFPDGALGCFEGERMCGYVLSFPWKEGEVFPLGTKAVSLPPTPDVYYVHDIAVSSSWRGRGVARLLMTEALKAGLRLGIGRFSLVAVQSSESVWSRFGFKPVESFLYAPGVPATRMVLERTPA